MKNTHESYVTPTTGKHWGYLQSLPSDYDDGNKEYPLVIFLHGTGESGNGTTELDRVAIHGYPRYAAEGKEYPFILISPQLGEGMVWWAHIESLNALLDHVLETLRVDPKRVYLTGLSNGGSGTWLWAEAYPQRFAALAPVCGAGIVWGTRHLTRIPTWAFHGDQDLGIDYHEAVRMVDTLNAMGGQAKLTLYPGVGHDCWTLAYTDDDLIEWMLAQHLSEE